MPIEVNTRISVSWEDLRNLSTEQCDAFMLGVAACVSADPRILLNNSETHQSEDSQCQK